jgi:hypothetical protein
MKFIVIVDIDGTISKVGDRIKYLKQDPKDWESFYKDCFEDEPICETCNLVVDLMSGNYHVVFCTGRREQARERTVNWLFRNGVIKQHSFYDKKQLLMRKDGDLRSDTIVKPELLREAGINFDEIAFVLEDRSKMVKKWRNLGLTCYQVDEGDF